MNIVLHNFLLDVPQAAVIWLALLAFALVAVAGMLVPSRSERAERRARQAEAARHRALLMAEAQESSRYADEVAVAAGRAATMVTRRRDDWQEAQNEVESAWRAYADADATARRLAETAPLRTPHTPHTPAEYADRERFLHRAAMAACWRGELSVLELSDAMAHRHGWDPRRHPVDQEVYLRHYVRDRLCAVHRAAAARERMAWHDAEMAVDAARSLRAEAGAAVVRARRASRRCESAIPHGGHVRPILRPVWTLGAWRAARTS